MKIHVVSGTDLTPGQLADWDRLQRSDPTAVHPFFRPEFTQLAALECPRVEVAVVEQGGQRVGFFPYQRSRGDVGRAVAWQMSDMHGMVLQPGVGLDAKRLLREAGLRAWHFDHVPAGQDTFRRFFRGVDDSYSMDLAHGYDRYRDERRGAGGSLILQAERKSRKLAREVGPLRFELHTAENSVFQALVEWKREQLRRQGGLDPLRLAWVAPLLRRVALHRAPHFTGLLSALYAGDALVAVHLGVRSGAELCSWVPAYNAAFAGYSPGVILHLELARSAADQGVRRIDLGRGENPMKLGLKSAASPVAIGSVERRPLQAVWTAGWYGARKLAHASPLGRGPLRVFRRLRGALTGGCGTGRIAAIKSNLHRTWTEITR